MSRHYPIPDYAAELNERYLESFESAARKIKNSESTQRINDNLTICDSEDDEDFQLRLF